MNGEEMTSQNDENEELQFEDTDNDNDTTENSISYEISNYPADMSMAEYKRKWENKTLIIPEFQRNYIWTKNDASKLIESILLGLPVPGVFLYKRREDNKFLVVDGQQRILSVIKFMEGLFNEKTFRLSSVRDKWNGKSFKELDDSERLQIEDSILRATIVQQLDPDDDTSIYHIFERLNTGGKNLNPMEVRRCVYAGKFASDLENLNKDENWRKLIGKKSPDIRYRDVELILRFFALAYDLEKYEKSKSMKSFLTNFMKDNKETEKESLQAFIKRFPEVCSNYVSAVGEKPFHLKGRLNYAVLDSTMATLITNEKFPSEFKRKFDALVKDENFLKAITYNTSHTSTINTRFERAKEMLLGD